jgi:hypothetical protein
MDGYIEDALDSLRCIALSLAALATKHGTLSRQERVCQAARKVAENGGPDGDA